VGGTGARSTRALIIDDDRLLAETLRMMIADFAATELAREVVVDMATNGRDAARVLEGSDDYAVVICDLSMPGIDGLSLYEDLVARGSPLAERFVLVTGGAFTPAAAAALARHALPCLEKPFDSNRLAATLRRFF
jgi:CheY-like chemotaxis protein